MSFLSTLFSKIHSAPSADPPDGKPAAASGEKPLPPQKVTMIRDKQASAGELYLKDDGLLFVGDTPTDVRAGVAVFSDLTRIAFRRITVLDEMQGLMGIITDQDETTLFRFRNSETMNQWFDWIDRRLDPAKIIKYRQIGYLNTRTERSRHRLLNVLKRCPIYVMCFRNNSADRPAVNIGSDGKMYVMIYTDPKSIPSKICEQFVPVETGLQHLLDFFETPEMKTSGFQAGGMFLDSKTETEVCLSLDMIRQ